MAVNGNLDPSFLTGLFQIFCDEKKTGLFKACFDNTQMEIYIENGTIVYARNFDGTHRLCDLLLQRGRLDYDMAQKAEEEVKKSGKTIGRALLDIGCLDKTQLAESIRELVQNLLLDLFLQTSGEFQYEDFQLELDKLLLVPINIRQIILETFRMIDELKLFERRLPNPDMMFALCEETRHRTPFEVDAVQWTILSLVHAKHPIKDIIKKSCYNVHTVYRTLINFMDQEMIKPLAEMKKEPQKKKAAAEESIPDKGCKPKDKPLEKGLFGLFFKKK